ncbi:hypothetical protein F511_23415 [Dorcoceras hygrometricum]|uniref:Uncharacterized protein n=1 Tax=Dorcoceras hygrometricum TaxID=472368 RepID=A0A2Z7C286_9LAMI|nr:hypothetical protein F511_23415 [Dorcoceras hygrometricum]
MASFVVNALRVNFDSVLSMDDAGMVRMFKSLEKSGLRGFLGVSRSIFEEDLNQFFDNSSVIARTIVSTVANRKMVITKPVFVEKFHLPTEGGTQVLQLVVVLTQLVVPQDVSTSLTSAAPVQSRSETSSDAGERPLAKLVAARPVGQASKRKPVTSPFTSESTSLLSQPEISKKPRTQRTKLVKPISTISATGLAVEKAASTDLPLQVRPYTEPAAQQSTSYGSGMVFAPMEIREINWATHFLPKIDPDAKGKESCPPRCLHLMNGHAFELRAEFDKTAPYANYDHMCIRFLEKELKEIMKNHRFQQFQVGLPILVPETSSAGNFSTDDTPEITWAEAHTLLKLRTTAIDKEAETAMIEQPAQELIAVEELPPSVQYFFVDQDEAKGFLEQPAPVEGLADNREEHLDQADPIPSCPTDSGIFIYSSYLANNEERQVPDSFDLDIVQYTEQRANMEAASDFAQDVGVEAHLVRKIDEIHQHFANEMTSVRLKLAEMVNFLKELSDAKKAKAVKRDD